MAYAPIRHLVSLLEGLPAPLRRFIIMTRVFMSGEFIVSSNEGYSRNLRQLLRSTIDQHEPHLVALKHALIHLR